MKARGWTPPPPVDTLGRQRGGRWRGRLRIPTHAHPLVRQLWAAMNAEHALMIDIAARSGVGAATMKGWAIRKSPQLVTFEAVANVLGYELALRRRREAES